MTRIKTRFEKIEDILHKMKHFDNEKFKRATSKDHIFMLLNDGG